MTGGFLVWSSNLDGLIGTGETCSSNTLGAGTHVITLTATDSDGASGSYTVTITVNGNTAPVAQITGPAEGSTYYVGDDVNFAGSGNDTEDGSLTGGSLAWTSNLDGQFCTGENCTSNTLSIGTHQITLTVTDSRGATDTDTITITITPALPDTGQTTSFTGTFGEDSDYTIHPPSYTKLDAVGNELDIGASDWVMVRDEVTGLIWEVKTDDSGIHDKDNTYTWQNSQDVFIAQLNTDVFGGHADWRRPTIRELAWIVNAESFDPCIDTTFFLNNQADYYWTATPAHSTSLNAWSVNFDTG